MAPASQPTINLIDENEMEHTPVGRIVSWAVTYGRYIMIGTEVIVLLAFISRFSLDRKLTDLSDEVSQKQDIITANEDFEQEFRTVQSQVGKIQTLLAAPATIPTTLNQIQSLMPPDVVLQTLTIKQDSIVGKANARTTNGLTQLMTNLQATPTFLNVDIGDVTRDPINGISFQFTITTKPTIALKK